MTGAPWMVAMNHVAQRDSLRDLSAPIGCRVVPPSGWRLATLSKKLTLECRHRVGHRHEHAVSGNEIRVMQVRERAAEMDTERAEEVVC